MAESDDENLRKAIALSLQDPLLQGQENQMIETISSDEEDDDLDAPMVARPIKLPSKSPMKANTRKIITPVIDLSGANDEATTVFGNKNAQSSTLHEAIAKSELGTPIQQPPQEKRKLEAQGIPGILNRKQMEEERLARVQKKREQQAVVAPSTVGYKRKATSPPPEFDVRDGRHIMEKPSSSLSSLQHPDDQLTKTSLAHRANDDGSIPSRKGMVTSRYDSGRQSCTNQTIASKTHQIQGNKIGPSKPSDVLSYHTQQQGLRGIQFPNGVVKKTWAFGSPRQGDDIKIEEVLQKDDLEYAVLSAFQIDPDWIATKIGAKTRVTWVLQAKTDVEKANIRSNAPGTYRFCYPSMEGNINCMHSKLQLLAHPSHLRIVVPSANLVPYDWGETGVMENALFLIDLPRYPVGKSVTPATFFAKELIHFLNAMGLTQKTIHSLSNFDFSGTTDLAFVHSIGGSHSGDNLKRTGYCGLGTAVKSLGLQSEQVIIVDIVSASIGSLTTSFINSLYLALQGNDGMTEYEKRISKPAKGKSQKEPAAERKLSDDLTRLFRIYFPTHDTVAKSKGGIGAGGTICTQSQWYNGDAFPRDLMRDCKSRREGLLMHNKMIFVRHQKDTEHVRKAWAYVGSANLSESAWGRLSKDRSTKEPKLNCRNWECGVIFPVRADETVDDKGGDIEDASPGIEIFTGHVPIPMVVPGEAYVGRKPWFFKDAL